MQADTIPAENYSIRSSEAFYGTPHYLPADTNLSPIPIENGTINDWMLPVIVLGLLCFTIAWYNFSPRIKLFMKAVFSIRHFKLVDKEGAFFRETPTYLMFGNFLLTSSLIIYQTLSYYELLLQWMPEHPVFHFLIIFASLLLFYPLKVFLIGFLAWVFNTPKASYLYLENIFLINNFAGLFIMPLVFYNAFNPSFELLLLMWATMAAVNVYKVIRGTYLAIRNSGFSAYYLFLYLCAVELAPLFIIGKAVTMYLPGVAGVIYSH